MDILFSDVELLQVPFVFLPRRLRLWYLQSNDSLVFFS